MIITNLPHDFFIYSPLTCSFGWKGIRKSKNKREHSLVGNRVSFRSRFMTDTIDHSDLNPHGNNNNRGDVSVNNMGVTPDKKLREPRF